MVCVPFDLLRISNHSDSECYVSLSLSLSLSLSYILQLDLLHINLYIVISINLQIISFFPWSLHIPYPISFLSTSRLPGVDPNIVHHEAHQLRSLLHFPSILNSRII
ncbi:hypothetical protein ACN38_g102 [Penicillium nordicum]|uniref:Uncharacterized protein n=1 Tax=Penicillium nordicum TaxID=229535 RepID=A0A0M8PB13_9EURO|nr:hypothetical protein ACN38_g102 [Penicillium nordicum]